MGISGLLGLLSPVTRDAHIEEFRGKTIAVDGLCWLHRGCYSCVREICTKQQTTKYLHFCEKMIKLLRKYDITPIIVIDGDSLVGKEKEDEKRKLNRQQRLQEGLELDKEGKRSEAYQKYVQAISVGLDIIGEFLQLLIRLKVLYIIAPYESDAQLAFLSRTGIVDAVISEDSDTLCYQCPKVLLKLSPEGSCKLIDLNEVYCTEKIGMLNWSPELFELMCVLNGCDYAKGCVRIGLKTAIKYINMGKSFKNTLDIIAAKPIHHFHDYEKLMYSALACFHHQVIYNPILNQREYLTPISEEEFEEYVKNQRCPFGDLKTESIAIRRAKGLISDDSGTQLIPSDSNVDYLDNYFKNVKPRIVSKRFALPLRMTKDNLVDVNELLKNHKNVIFDKPTSVKCNNRNPINNDLNPKRFHDDSPTSVVIYDCTSLSDDSFSEGFMNELEHIEKTLDK